MPLTIDCILRARAAILDFDRSAPVEEAIVLIIIPGLAGFAMP